MRLQDFDYTLPAGCIARFPAEPRESARLLVVDRRTGDLCHKNVGDLVELLSPNDLVVINDTRVIPARLFAHDPTGKVFEILLLKPLITEGRWRCLIRPGKKIRGPQGLILKDNTEITVVREPEGFKVLFPPTIGSDFFGWLATVGEPPIPPYLERSAEASDWTRYQTVFAKTQGAVAAPTAGLHFSDSLVQNLTAKKILIASITLHVGYGTFAPLSELTLAANELHAESYWVPLPTLEAVAAARERGSRVVCVGTTSLRALESVASLGNNGTTRLFIKPGFKFQYATALMTNFHLPQSSLLVLVSAFLGSEKTRSCYRAAVANGYRFYSYGDAMIVL